MFLDEGEFGGESKSIRSQAEVSQSCCCSLSGFVPFLWLYLPWEFVAEKSPSSGKTCGHVFFCVATAVIPLCNEKQPVKILSSPKEVCQ